MRLQASRGAGSTLYHDRYNSVLTHGDGTIGGVFTDQAGNRSIRLKVGMKFRYGGLRPKIQDWVWGIGAPALSTW